MDVAIAATDSDEQNAIAALQAKRLGIERVIAIAQDPAYVSLLEESGMASLIEMVVPEESPVVGRRIQDIDVPEQCVVAAVLRDGQFVVPRGETEIRAGDEVVFVGPDEAIQTAHDRFSAKVEPAA